MVSLSDDVHVLPEVQLRPVITGSGRLSDPVDPEAGQLVPETTARRYGLLPFAVTPEGIDVAVSRLPTAQAEQVLADLGRPVRLFRCSPIQVQAAQSRVWQSSPPPAQRQEPARTSQPMARLLGDLLVEQGQASADVVQDALAHQAASGGRLGGILTSSNTLTSFAVAQAVARQHELPLVDLQVWEDGHQRLQTLDPQLFHLMPESFWRDRLLAPLGLGGNQLTVAMVDPNDLRGEPVWSSPRSTGRLGVVYPDRVSQALGAWAWCGHNRRARRPSAVDADRAKRRSAGLVSRTGLLQTGVAGAVGPQGGGH